MFLCDFWEIFKNTYFSQNTSSCCFWKYTYEDTRLSSFFLALKGEGSDENYDNNIKIVLNFELPIVAEIAIPTQNEIVKLKGYLRYKTILAIK